VNQRILIVGAAAAMAIQLSEKLKGEGHCVEVIDEKSLPQEERTSSLLKDMSSAIERQLSGAPSLNDRTRQHTQEMGQAIHRLQQSEKVASKLPFFVHGQGKQTAQWKTERSRKRGPR
jgi:hypothetical protein